MKAKELQAFNLFIIVGDKSRKIYEFSNICQDGENCKVLDFWQKAHYIDINTSVIKLSK